MGILTRLGSEALEGSISLDEYRSLFRYPTWNGIIKAITSTRAYQDGLEAGLALLEYTENNRDRLSEDEFEDNLRKLCLFVLTMLDKMDQWEEYLETWESIRTNTDFALTYSSGSRKHHGERIEPFVLDETSNTLYVHFLWTTLHRKEVIERKLERKRAGHKTGNLLHATQDELSPEEIQDRFDWVCRLAERAPEYL